MQVAFRVGASPGASKYTTAWLVVRPTLARRMSLDLAKTQVDTAFTRPQGQTGLSYENAFGGATSFLRRRYTKNLDGVDLAVTGIPFDQAVTNRPGARFGPRAVREASTLQPFDAPYGWNGLNPIDEFDVVDYGDLAFDYAMVSDFPEAVETHITTILSSGLETKCFFALCMFFSKHHSAAVLLTL